MSAIDDMMKSFTTLAETQEFVKAQHDTIMELTKKVQALEEKKLHLENLLQSATPTLVGEYTPIVQVNTINEAYEENICKMELKKLHDISLERQLTYEETKKVDIFTKLLLAISQKPKGQLIDTKKKDTSELLKLVSNETNGSEKL